MFEKLVYSASLLLIFLFWALIALIFIWGVVWVKFFKNSRPRD